MKHAEMSSVPFSRCLSMAELAGVGKAKANLPDGRLPATNRHGDLNWPDNLLAIASIPEDNSR